MSDIRIGRRLIGLEHQPYFVADIGANHDGDLRRAFKLIGLAKEAGADAAKFQNFTASKIVSKKGFEDLGGQMSHQSSWTKPVVDVYEEASLPYDWSPLLKEKCNECGIEFFTSPYDFESVDRVDPYVNVYKIGSGDITWHDIVAYIAGKGKPVFIATGASSIDEVKMAMAVLSKNTNDIVLMQCNTNYTGSVDNFKFVNLNVLKTYAALYPNTVLGLSDHTPGSTTVLGALALGARVFEKHFTDDNSRDGPDHRFAMNPRSWREMVTATMGLYQAMGDGQKRIEANEQDTAVVQRRGLRFTRDLTAGHVLVKDDMFPLRPRTKDGVPPYEINGLVGRRLKRNVLEDSPVTWSDLEE